MARFLGFLGVVVVSSMVMTSQAFSRDENSTKRLDKIITEKFSAIEENKTPAETSEIIMSLQDFPQRSVLIYVLNKLDQEVSKERPNTYHIMAYLEVIESMGSHEEMTQLKQTQSKFQNALNVKSKVADKIIGKFEEVGEKIQNNLTPLPKDVLGEREDQETFKMQLFEDASGAHGKERMNAAKVLLTATTAFMTDDVRQARDNGSLVQILGRDKETDRGIDTLVRIKGKNPIFIGIPGVGKTAAAERMAQIIVESLYPPTQIYKDAFDNAEMLQVTPARISRLAKSNDPNSMAEAVEMVFDSVLFYEQEYVKEHQGQKKPILVFIDEFHSLGQSQIEALLPYMDAREKGIMVLGASNSDKFQLNFKHNEALLRRVEQIGLEEFDEAMTIKILKASWIPVIEKKYNVEFTEEAIEVAVKVAPFLQPDTARPDGPFKVLQGLAINVHRGNVGRETVVSDSDIYSYAQEITGLPLNPHDGKAFQAFIENKEKEINSVVVEQYPVVHQIMGKMANLFSSTPKRPQVMAIIGTTGTGKTLIAETLAEKIYGSKRRALVINGNDYQTGGYSLNTLLGASNGLVTSDKKSGVLCDFLDDPSQGKFGGVIVINEAEKMHPDGWKRLMEFFDKGIITGGDGKIRFANRHIIILTSNRGAKIVFPDTVTKWSQSEINRRVASLEQKDIKALFMQKTDGNDEFQLPPEVLGRVDGWAIANPASPEGAVEVGQREANRVRDEVKFQYHFNLEIDPSVIQHLSLTGFSVTEGYRQVAKQIDSYLKALLTEVRSHWNMPRDSAILVSVLKDANAGKVKLVATNPLSHEKVMVEAPEQKFDNPLQDKEVLEKLQRMPEVMKTRIIGQDAALRSVTDAILAKYADVSRKTAVTFGIVGPTGVGKTEIGRGIAEALYGSSDRLEIIPLGDVNFEGKLNDIFNSPAGYVDSHKIGKFERALMNNPDGGVVVFDEFSNMGGGKKELKEALLKQYFYQILDEGTWTSTSTGKTYDLKKYVFEFTGNDLQEVFTGLDTDKQRIDAYEETNNKMKIRAALVQNGIPEAFLGRFADFILAKPLLSTEMKGVTEKELNNQIKRLTEQHRGLKITYDDQFLTDFTRAFFSPDTGGRSVKTALDNRLGSLIGTSLMGTGHAGQDLSGFVFTLHVSDTLTSKPYKRTQAPERKVLLGVEVFKDGQKINFIEKDFTEFASDVTIPIGKHAEATAYHEAGHAVLNDPALTNYLLDFITIRYAHVRGLNGEMLTAKGYASYKPIPGTDTNPDYEKTIALLAKSWGGRVSQELAGLPPDAGWSEDLKQMRNITTQYLTTWGLDDELIGVALDKDGKPVLNGNQKNVFEKKQNELIEIGHQLAIQGLKMNWPLVRGIVAEIMRSGDIDGVRAQALMERVKENLKKEDALRESAQKGKVEISSNRPIASYDEWEARLKKRDEDKASQVLSPTECSSWMAKLIPKKKIGKIGNQLN